MLGIMVPELIVKTRGFILSQLFDWTDEGHSDKPSSVDQRLACSYLAGDDGIFHGDKTP
jgi:hypothetical protein